MAAKQVGLHEVRTRVTCNLPVNNWPEEQAFFAVLEYLKSLRNQAIGVSGFTHSMLRPAAYLGYWWPDDAQEPVRDRIVICTVDYRLEFSSQQLSQQVKSLKQSIRKWYRHFGSPQDEIWVIAHPVMRQD